MTAVPSERERLRAGDRDRDRASRYLADAYADGRLSHDEYSERCDRALAAKHLADLDALLSDLTTEEPATALARVQQPRTPAPVAQPAFVGDRGIPLSLAIMSGTERRGAWRTSATHTAIAFWGGVEIDLREASFDAPHSTIWCGAVMGGIEVIVPPHVRLQVEGLAIMGGFGVEGPAINPADLPSDAPVVTIRGFAFWGGVGVTREGYEERPRELER